MSDEFKNTCEVNDTWWKFLLGPRTYKLVLLIIAGLTLEFIVHLWFGIPVVYTHFYYLIIVLAGLWYGTRAVLLALFFGGLHIVVTYILTGTISPDALARALMLCTVAFVVGSIAGQLRGYHDQLLGQNQELQKLATSLTAANEQLETSKTAFMTANRKLNLLASITRHDIHNQMTALLGYIGLIREQVTDPGIRTLLDKEERAAENIVRQIEFTKNYEELGVHAPLWQDVAAGVQTIKTASALKDVRITTRLEGLEIYADPLFEKVTANLIDNSLRHGERVKHITFSTLPYANNAIALVYEDDGIGVHEEDRERIFEKGFGKHTGLGLFLVREILAITGITIREHGTYGKGARFEIHIPQGKYRFTGQRAPAQQ